jgi:hypothetical protein
MDVTIHNYISSSLIQNLMLTKYIYEHMHERYNIITLLFTGLYSEIIHVLYYADTQILWRIAIVGYYPIKFVMETVTMATYQN